MKAVKQQRERRALGIAGRRAGALLALALSFVFIYHACDLHSLLSYKATAQLTGNVRLPNRVLRCIDASNLKPVISRSAHWTALTTLSVPVSLSSFVRVNEFQGERHMLAVLIDSGLEVRAPPQGFSS